MDCQRLRSSTSSDSLSDIARPILTRGMAHGVTRRQNFVGVLSRQKIRQIGTLQDGRFQGRQQKQEQKVVAWNTPNMSYS